MQRLLAITSSVLILSACSHLSGRTDADHSNYRELAQIAKQQDAQYALLLTRDAKVVVVNVNTGQVIRPNERQNPSSQKADKNHTHDNKTATERPPLSDAEFAELKRKFDRTIAVEVTRGSECIEFIDLGMRFRDCSPNSPKWW